MTTLEYFSTKALDVKHNVELKDYLSLKIGGIADYFMDQTHLP